MQTKRVQKQVKLHVDCSLVESTTVVFVMASASAKSRDQILALHSGAAEELRGYNFRICRRNSG